MELLRLPWKSATWRGISLMVKVKKCSRRVVWMVAIWCASVLLLAGVGMLFRLLMTSAGFRS
ncbi:TPA: DUF2474 domain-containing protein [Salmonella enterica]